MLKKQFCAYEWFFAEHNFIYIDQTNSLGAFEVQTIWLKTEPKIVVQIGIYRRY